MAWGPCSDWSLHGAGQVTDCDVMGQDEQTWIRMLKQFFDTSAIDAFAAVVVADLLKTLPPAQCDSASKKAQKGREQAQERIRRSVDGFAVKSRLNVYQKAKLGLRLQDGLEAAGYPSTFAKPFAYDVVSQVAAKAAR